MILRSKLFCSPWKDSNHFLRRLNLRSGQNGNAVAASDIQINGGTWTLGNIEIAVIFQHIVIVLCDCWVSNLNGDPCQWAVQRLRFWIDAICPPSLPPLLLAYRVNTIPHQWQKWFRVISYGLTQSSPMFNPAWLPFNCMTLCPVVTWLSID